MPLLCMTALLQANLSGAETAFHVLAYHDVRDRVADDFDQDQYAISTRNLIDHFSWLRINGFVPVSIEQILAAQTGGPKLPEHAILLTFDDGLKSVYTHVFPLLRVFGYPAVVSVVTAWIEGSQEVEQAGRMLTREDFVSWAEIREMRESGLIEIASHSHDLHTGVAANPQNNQQPAAVSLRYGAAGYEQPADYSARIDADLATSARLLEERGGQRPRVVTWPFGAYNVETLATARKQGMSVSLTLRDGPNQLADLQEIKRHLIQANPGVEQLAYALLHPPSAPLIRAAQVDLDYVYDPDPQQQELNLGRLLDRIKALQISHVFLQAFADPDADGAAQAVYFPNDHLPMRADLFNRAAWQLSTRSNVKVYAWLPLLGFEGSRLDPGWYVQQADTAARDPNGEPRLSPFEPRATAAIKSIYAAMARHAAIDGLLFHDDGRLNELEDANPAAHSAYRAKLGADFSIDAARDDPALLAEWTRFKAARLIELSLELAQIVRAYRPGIKTARNLFAPALLDPNAPNYLAQRYPDFLSAYDHVALMAMPYFEGADSPERFFRALVEAARLQPHGLSKTIFELQTVDWRNDRPIPAVEISRTMRRLQSMGVRHLAYYPDDFISGQPQLNELRKGISLAVYPLGDRQ